MNKPKTTDCRPTDTWIERLDRMACALMAGQSAPKLADSEDYKTLRTLLGMIDNDELRLVTKTEFGEDGWPTGNYNDFREGFR